MPVFSKEHIRVFLDQHGYTTHPEGLIQFFSHDYQREGDGVAYLDVNAQAVRKGDEVPDRPLRMTFHKVAYGPSDRWELKSVEELAPGVATKALGRDPYFPKVSPWPDSNLQPGGKKAQFPAPPGQR